MRLIEEIEPAALSEVVEVGAAHEIAGAFQAWSLRILAAAHLELEALPSELLPLRTVGETEITERAVISRFVLPIGSRTFTLEVRSPVLPFLEPAGSVQ